MPATTVGRWRRLLPIAVLTVGVMASIAAGVLQAGERRAARERAFESRAEIARSSVQDRLRAIEDSLLGLRNSMVLLWPVDRVTFRQVTDVSEDLEALDAIQALSFVRAVPRDDIRAFEAGVRADDTLQFGGYPDFAVTPAESEHDMRYVVEYLEPLFGNEAAFGFDIGSEPTRRAAIELARDRGEVVATAPITLVQESGTQHSILLLLGVYESDEIPTTAPARRRHFVGAVSTVVRVGDLLADVLGTDNDIDIEIYDVGITEEPPDEVLTDERLLHHLEGRRVVQPDGTVDGLHTRLDLDVGGRRWRLVATPNDAFGANLGAEPWAVAAVVGLLALAAAGAVAYVTGEQRRTEALVEMRTADLRQLILSAPDATLVVDRSGTIRLASNQVFDILGYRPEELIGTRVESLLPEDQRERHVTHRDRFTEAPEARAMLPRGALRARHKSGREIPVAINLAPIGQGDVIAAVRDVTLQEQARRELERSNDQKAAFLGTMSHELRTPLTAIHGFVRLLLDPDRDFDESVRREFLERIGRNADALQTVIEEVLEYSLLDRGTYVVEPTTQDLAEVVDTTLDGIESTEPMHELRRDLRSTRCAFDTGAVRRILTNLMSNAVAYSPEQTVVTVTVRPAEDGGGELIVDDQGPGVPEVDRDRVFERFWRGRNALDAAIGGTGIGLAVVAELADLLDGTAEVQTSPDGGARFVVSFPAGNADAEQGAQRTHA